MILKQLRKLPRLFILLACCIVAAGVLLLLAFKIDQSTTAEKSIWITLEADGTSETVLPQWEEEQCIFYLPSFADEAVVSVTADPDVYIDDTPAAEVGSQLTEGKHSLRIGSEVYDLEVYRSANVGTVWIDTGSGQMDGVYEDTSRRERVDIAAFTAAGELDYQSSKASIKVRGNSTSKLDKKPFNLNLEQESTLLGLDASKHFALLANGFDRTGLRDALYKKLAAAMEFGYETDTVYVDVYLNGEYNGLYVLSEKIEVSETALDLEEGSFLCAIELKHNMKEGDVYVDSLLQDVFEICYPEDPTAAELNTVEAYLAAFERALSSEDGVDPQTGRSWDEMIDVESWAKGYVLDEVLENVDTCLASSYLYYDASDGLLYKGPAWDGDRTLGNQYMNRDPETLTAAQGHGTYAKTTVYYAYLLKQEEFCSAVERVYEAYDFQTLLEGMIDEFGSEIEQAKVLDDRRWGSLYDENEEKLKTTVTASDAMKAYVEARVSYLDEVMPELESYAVIYIFKKRAICSYVTVKKGTIYTPEDTSVRYVDLDTGKYVDFSQPVNENMAVRIKKRKGKKS